MPPPAAPDPSAAAVGGSALVAAEDRPARTGRSALFVGVGILLSRLVGLARQRVFAHFFGDSWVADAFSAALRLPNITQNLLGEGTLSASFIPVYARSLGRGDRERAGEFARAALGLLSCAVALLSLAGVLGARPLTHAMVPGFAGEKLELTVKLVRVFFPMTGLLALSAWSLGILNSHRRFFLPYAAPVVWSLAQIAALLAGSRFAHGAQLAIWLGDGALLGGALQLLIQLPTVRGLLGGHLWPTRRWRTSDVREATRTLGPVIVGRGVVQLSALLDTFLASLLGTGANAALGYVQTLYILPVSLFGVGEAAAALPEMAREAASRQEAADGTAAPAPLDELRRTALRSRLAESLTRVGFTTVPTTLCFIVLAKELVGALFQTGRFDAHATGFVASALAAYILGLCANASVRVMASAFYAVGDTKTPARFAIYRVAASAALSYLLMRRFGIVGLCLGAASAGWLEAIFLGHRLRQLLGGLPLPLGRWLRFLAASLLAALVGGGLARLGAGLPVILRAAASLPAFGSVYLLASYAMGTPDVVGVVGSLRRRLRR